MAFSSHSGNTRRGGWANSILPSANPKSKLPRKSRRRTFFREFIFANFFTIGLSVSVFILILVVLRYGVPKPLSTHFKSRTSRFSKLRKQASRKPSFSDDGVSGAAVDITTKDLYDKIEFSDVDGGPWKQGWRVSYKGDEWDSEKLKVFVVPHSHNDPGWKRTVEEYYQQQSRHILDTIIETLSKDSKRKFIWEEMSYLERWWRDASTTSKHTFMRLVKNGQLEIVGGGWVMNDEANSHYFAIIEQITEGNLWLNETIGVVPKNSWAIDPFGYSPTMAYLLRRMGFENMVIQRTHYELKKELALHKNLEYIWRQSWDSDETTDIFVHMMPFYSYDIPHTCGPEPAICCQFDFARMHGSSYELCPWGEHPVETDTINVHSNALKLLDQYKKKSSLYRTNTLLVPLGDDFRFVSVEEAESQFKNYEMLFDYINSSPSLNSEVKFGTLEDYFVTLRDEAERINYSLPGEIGSGEVPGFPSLSGDFFTYADRERDYWSGYYVSRPFFKAVDRVLEQSLRATDMMIALLLGHCHRALCEKLPVGFAYKLTAAKRNLALFQHHDGVTGTAKDHVVVDYGSRMFTSLNDLQVFMSRGIEVLLGFRHEKPGQNPPLFEAEEVRSKFDVQAMHREMAGREGTSQTVVLFNPLEQNRNEVVMVVVRRSEVAVLDLNWTCVKSQVSPQFQYNDKGKVFTGRHRLHWTASVPAMGLQTYYIVNGFAGCEKSEPAKIKLSPNLKPLMAPYDCSHIEDGGVVEIRNRHMKLAIDAKLGLLQFVTNINGTVTAVGEEIGVYSSSGSGAYLFKPNGEAESISGPGGKIVVVEGPLMQEVFTLPETPKYGGKTPLSHSTRIYNGESTIQELMIEKEYHVELTGNDFNDKELIARYKTDIENKRVFYSDLNGFQMIRRETYDKIPLQGNYYPMPSMAFIQANHGRRFSVHSRQSLGVASLKNGWLEIMLDRRLVSDDGRGLGQGVMDNKPMNVVFHILIESNKSSINPTPPTLNLNPSILSHSIGARLNYPLLLFIAKKPHDLSVRPSVRAFSPLSSPLPCDLHVVSLKVPRLLKYGEEEDDRRFSLILHRRKWDSSYCHEGRSDCKSVANEVVNFSSIFKRVSIRNVKPTSLNVLHEDMEMLGYGEQFHDGDREERVLMAPMEIRAYKLDMRAHQEEMRAQI